MTDENESGLEDSGSQDADVDEKEDDVDLEALLEKELEEEYADDEAAEGDACLTAASQCVSNLHIPSKPTQMEEPCQTQSQKSQWLRRRTSARQT